jgi:adenylyl cyclase-associated protein
VVTTKAKKPDIQSAAYADMFKELQSKMGAVDDIRHANRQSPLFNHLNTVADGMSMIGWVTIEPKPVESVKNALDSAKFYGNRVYKEYKDKYVVSPFNNARAHRIPGIIPTLNGSRRTTASSTPSPNTLKNTTRPESPGTTRTGLIRKRLFARFNQASLRRSQVHLRAGPHRRLRFRNSTDLHHLTRCQPIAQAPRKERPTWAPYSTSSPKARP